jgi:ABC-type sugar transport system substrate-binding protein
MAACRIALFLMDGGAYQDLLREECFAVSRRYGFSVRTFCADNDAATQVRQLEDCLAEPPETRPTFVLVHPVRETLLIAVAHKAARMGIGWVMLNRWSDCVDDLRQEFPDRPAFCVMPDQREVGCIQGRQFRALMPEGGELVYIRGPLGAFSAARRLEGMQETLQNCPIRVFSVNSDWTTSGGEEAMRSWMRLFDGHALPPFVVGAQNDAMAVGALRAYEIHSGVRFLASSSARFTGCDGSPSFGKRFVEQNRLAATVLVPPTTGRAVTVIASLLGGGPPPAATILLAPHSFPALSALEALGRGEPMPGTEFAGEEETRVRPVAGRSSELPNKATRKR